MKKHLLLITLLTLVTGAHLAFAADVSGSNFVSLTNIPPLEQVAQSSTLSELFNNLYMICIGAAAVITVFQLIRAGIMWMSAGDSAENVSKARGLISSSIFGLVLVLSPTIVFSIINPKILNLDLNMGSVQVNPQNITAQDPTSAIWESHQPNAKEVCQQRNGTYTVVSTAPDGTDTIRCTQNTPAGSCTTPFPIGNTAINATTEAESATQQACCTKQAGCTLEARTRGQYACSCASS